MAGKLQANMQVAEEHRQTIRLVAEFRSEDQARETTGNDYR